MSINRIKTKNILQKSKLPSANYVINPYIGCVHGCAYCYARYMKRFTGHSEDWGKFLDVKINAVEALETRLAVRKEALKETVFLSSVTDPYQPPEKLYRLTRGLLEVLLAHQIPVSILTKSDLVLRDIDLLEKFENCSVGLSLMTLDEELARRMEPRAMSPARRIQALHALRERGIRTYAFISPILPMITDIERLLEELNGGIDEIGAEAINTGCGNWHEAKRVLAVFASGLADESERLSKEQEFWDTLEAQLHQLAGQYRIGYMGFYRH